MAPALALCLGAPRSLGPWLYPLYYVALLLPRHGPTTGAAPRSTARSGRSTASASPGASSRF